MKIQFFFFLTLFTEVYGVDHKQGNELNLDTLKILQLLERNTILHYKQWNFRPLWNLKSILSGNFKIWLQAVLLQKRTFQIRRSVHHRVWACERLCFWNHYLDSAKLKIVNYRSHNNHNAVRYRRVICTDYQWQLSWVLLSLPKHTTMSKCKTWLSFLNFVIFSSSRNFLPMFQETNIKSKLFVFPEEKKSILSKPTAIFYSSWFLWFFSNYFIHNCFLLSTAFVCSSAVCWETVVLHDVRGTANICVCPHREKSKSFLGNRKKILLKSTSFKWWDSKLGLNLLVTYFMENYWLLLVVFLSQSFVILRVQLGVHMQVSHVVIYFTTSWLPFMTYVTRIFQLWGCNNR